MHRLTARFVLILLLVGVFAPVALAISTPAPHACCLRKPMHSQTSHNSEFHAPPSCCQHDCCRALAVSQWAQLTRASVAYAACSSAPLHSAAPTTRITSSAYEIHSGRAPPHFSTTWV
jgi:hypothetical protein